MHGIKDLTGQKFSELTVLRLGEKQRRRWKWVVLCSCGAETSAFGNNLIRGFTKSCGCKQGGEPNVSVGERFKRLVVVDRVESTETGSSRWLCRCDCGKKKVISGKNLVRGYTGSCGCYGKIPREMTAFNMAFGRYKTNARSRAVEWGLSDSAFRELIEDRCHYCGKYPTIVEKLRGVKLPYLHNGVDRKDSGIGYVEGNVVTCCTGCNRAKGVKPYEEFLAWVKEVAYHQVEIGTFAPITRNQTLAAASR